MSDPERGRIVETFLHLVRGLYPLGQVPPATPDPPPAKQPPPQKQQEFTHASWPGVIGCPYLVNRRQAAVLQVLREAYVEGCPCVKEEFLLRAAKRAGSDAIRLREVFQGTRLWGRMIIAGYEPGTYRLPDVPDEGDG